MFKEIVVECILVCYILFVCNTLVQCAGKGNGVKCNASMTCPETFTCEHYEGCKFGECVCPEPWYYLHRNKKSCMKRTDLPGHGEYCRDGVCQENLICRKCDWVVRHVRNPTCRKKTLPIDAPRGSGGRWHGAPCTARVGCAEGWICHISEDCKEGICRCKPGYSYLDRSSDCVKITVFPKIGERCERNKERDICEDLTPCSRCPGDNNTTCIGRLVDYEKSTPLIRTSTKVTDNLSHHGCRTTRIRSPYDNETESVNNTNVTPFFRKKSGGGISPAIYVLIPIALILIGIAVCLVVKRTSDGKGKFESVEKPAEAM